MRRLLPMLALLVLAACEQPTAPTAAAPAAAPSAPPGFTCPTAGTRVEIRPGRPDLWTGADPADPAICLVTTGLGQRERRLLGLIALPAEDEPAWRAGLWPLWPLEAGRSSSFTGFARNFRGERVFYRHEWRVEGAQRLRIGSQTRETTVLRVRTTYADGGRGRHDVVRTIWLDSETGAPVWVNVNERQGISGDRSFAARSIGASAR
jgi:hypothetical protein